MARQSPALPFEGLLVVELGARLGASACGSLLAMTGADIVLVESADPLPVGKTRIRAVTAAGKKSLLVRAGSVDDEALADQALAAADVVIISSDMPSPVDHSAHVRPDAIICDVTALADSVPHAHLLDDRLLQALSGIGIVTGTAEGKPTLSDAAILDLGAGIYAAAAVVAALRVRRLHGGGQHVAASMYGTGVNGLVTFLPFHFNGKMPSRGGNRHPMCAPWNAYQATDGWILLCSANDDQWRRLCGVMSRPELAADGDLATLSGRLKHVEATDAIVQAWVGTKSVADAVAACGAAGIAAGPIVAIDELDDNPNIKHRRMVRTAIDPESRKKVKLPASPLRQGRVAHSIPARDSGRAFVQSLTPRAPDSRTPTNDQVRPLEGIRVLEIGQYTTAPLAAKQLATLGAEVLKVEPLTGESSRAWPPHLNGESYFFTMNNANKRSLAVDLRRPTDRDLFADLLRNTDILVENLKPGSLARLGFSDDEMHRINPGLVYCAISGYGADSIYPGRPAFDTVIQAMCGLMDLTRAEGVPTKLGVSIADTMGGMMGMFFILAMLEQRDKTGRGVFIDLAMQDVGVWATHNAWDEGARTPTCIISCQDGDVAILSLHETAKRALDKANIHASSSTRATIAQALMEQGIPAAPIRTVDEIGMSDQAEGGFIRMVQDGPNRWPLLEPPFRLSRMRDYALRPIGALGAANEDLLRAKP